MPSVSKSQQRLMGVAYAVKSGDMKINDVDPAYREKVKGLVDGMTKKDLKKYASTKHEDLPETVDEMAGTGAVSLNPGQTIGGMGDVTLPVNGELGSGDLPHAVIQVADIDDDLEKEKKRNKKKVVKNLEMENFNIYTRFNDFLNEATDYNDPVLIRLRQDKLRREDMKKLDALKKEAEKNKKKAMKRWNDNKYDQWLEDVASNDGWKNAYDMARNAEFEPGLIDWVKKEYPGEDVYQRIQWDIEAFAESVVTEAKAVKRFDKKLIDSNFQVHQVETLKTIYKGVSGNVDYEVVKKWHEMKGLDKLPEDWRGQQTGTVYQLKRNLYLWVKPMEDTRNGRGAVDEWGDAFFNVMSIFTFEGDEIVTLWERPSSFKVATYGGPGVNIQYESVVTEGFSNLKISGPAYDLWNDREVQKKLRGVKIRIVGDEDGVLTVRGHDDELQKVKDIDLCCIESVVTEGVLSDVRKAVEKTKKALKKKWDAKGGYENFGQDEISDLQDKYDYSGMVYGTPEERKAAKLIDGLDQWAMNYVGESEVIVNEKKLDRDDMMAWIGKYMDFVKTTEEFNGSQGGIWVSGENGDEYKGREIYDYYSSDYKNRTFGVDNRWEKELNKRGWYSEWHDAGTSMIWPL